MPTKPAIRRKLRPETTGREPAGPVPAPPEGGGGGEDWALLTTARNHVEAHLIQGRLAQESIEVMLDATNLSPGAWLQPFGDPMAPVRVYVHRRDLSRATMTLHEVDHRPPDPASPGPRGIRWMFWGVVAVILLLAALEILDFAPCVLGIFCL